MTSELRQKWFDQFAPGERLQGFLEVDPAQEVVIVMEWKRGADKSRIVSNNPTALMRFVENLSYLTQGKVDGEPRVIMRDHKQVGLFYVLKGEARQKAMDLVHILPSRDLDEFIRDFF